MASSSSFAQSSHRNFAHHRRDGCRYEGITVRLKPAPHQRIEFRFADHQVQSLTLWSREAMHPDWPNNDMRPIWKVSRDHLFGGDFTRMFEQFAVMPNGPRSWARYRV